MPAGPFLTVEMPGLGLLLGSLTKDHPNSRADAVLESVRHRPDGLDFSSLVVAQGLPPATWESFLADLRVRYNQKPEIVAAAPDKRVWVYRMSMAVSNLTADLKSLVEFQQEFGVPWMRIVEGRASLVGPVRGEKTKDAIQRVQKAFKALGIEGHVEVDLLNDADRAAWLRLRSLVADLHRGLPEGSSRPTWWRLDAILESQS